MNVPTNTPHSFGEAHHTWDAESATSLDVLREAPAADPQRKVPTVTSYSKLKAPISSFSLLLPDRFSTTTRRRIPLPSSVCKVLST